MAITKDAKHSSKKHMHEIAQTEIYSKTLQKAQRTQGFEYFDSFNTFRSKQKLQKALKSCSNFSLALFGKGRKILRTTLTNPSNNLNKSMQQLLTKSYKNLGKGSQKSMTIFHGKKSPKCIGCGGGGCWVINLGLRIH